ncbi:MAG TPA: ABC transporter permease [Dehalococcoidia bacterium]|nr:ABC transporter permease [Dehalococcoidia bacterium]
MATRSAEVVPVWIAGASWYADLRAVRVVWKREIIRFSRARIRIVTALAQPVLFLFVMGTGLSPLVQGQRGQTVDFRTFMFPGVIAMTVLFTAIFSAMSIVWDREFGFLREMLVAPVRRGSLVLGKCLGGATIATLQGVIILALARLVHVPYSPLLLLTLVSEMALLAFALTALGVLVASRVQQVESFQVVMQFLVLPMFFLSGAVFPLSRLPTWLQVLTRIDPLSYAVDPMRRAVFSHVSISASMNRSLNPGITWSGWRVPVGLELGLVALLGAVMLTLAIAEFSRSE